MMKFNDLVTLELLFSNNDSEIMKALHTKANWLNLSLVLEGNLDHYVDEDNIVRYPFLENLFDNVIEFSDVNYTDRNIDEIQLDIINLRLCEIKRAIFKKNIDLTSNCPFYVVYNFGRLDETVFKMLFPNFYFMHSKDELDINFNEITTSLLELIKICLIGDNDEACFLLSEDCLINKKLFLPVVEKIVVNKKIPDDLMKELLLFGEDNEVEVEVIL